MYSGISSTGKNLNIIMSCEHSLIHDWMTFSCWYSIKKNLPDSKFHISCLRTKNIGPFFMWARKFKIPFFQHSDKNKDLQELFACNNAFIISPGMMAIYGFIEDSLGPSDVKDDEKTTFVSYLNGCGRFTMSEWVDRMSNPFSFVDKLYSDDLSLNEYKVLKLWEQCALTYNSNI